MGAEPVVEDLDVPPNPDIDELAAIPELAPDVGTPPPDDALWIVPGRYSIQSCIPQNGMAPHPIRNLADSARYAPQRQPLRTTIIRKTGATAPRPREPWPRSN